MGSLKPSLLALHPQTILTTFSGWAAVLLRSPNPGEEPQGVRSLLEDVAGLPPLSRLEVEYITFMLAGFPWNVP